MASLTQPTPVTERTKPGNGQVVPQEPEPSDTVLSFPIVLLWEGVLALGVILVIFTFALLKQAPLEEIANPLVTTDPAKAPWYFVGLQEMFDHMHPTLAGVIIPGLLVASLMALPYIDHSRAQTGVWFSSPRGKRIVAATAVYTVLVMTAYIVLDNTFSPRELLRETAPLWVAQGVVPGGILAALVALPALVVWRLKDSTTRELALVLFTALLFAAIVFTTSGFLFRGPGFKLYWPWAMPDGYNPWNGL